MVIIKANRKILQDELCYHFNMPTTTNPDLLNLLRCPINHSSLQPASASQLQMLNEKIERGELRNQNGEQISEPIQGGLINAEQSWLLPIRGGIVVLVVEQAISIQ